MSMKPTKPHCESQRPYGYRFNAIDLYMPQTYEQAVSLLMKHKDHRHDISIDRDSPHVERIIWHVATFIEGNLGCCYKATLIFSKDHGDGTLFIRTPEDGEWWDVNAWRSLSSYLMGLRSLMDLIE